MEREGAWFIWTGHELGQLGPEIPTNPQEIFVGIYVHWTTWTIPHIPCPAAWHLAVDSGKEAVSLGEAWKLMPWKPVAHIVMMPPYISAISIQIYHTYMHMYAYVTYIHKYIWFLSRSLS